MQPACVIVKHANPCGVAVAARPRSMPTAGLSRPTRLRRSAASSPSIASSTRETAEAVSQQFVEVLIAPRVGAEARKVLAAKTNVRVLEVRDRCRRE